MSRVFNLVDVVWVFENVSGILDNIFKIENSKPDFERKQELVDDKIRLFSTLALVEFRVL